MQVTVEVWLSAVSGAVALLVAGYSWQRRGAPGARALAAFLVASAVWASGNALQSAATTRSLKLFAVDVQYVGIAIVPIAWIVFAAAYTGHEEWLTRRTYAALAVVPAVTLALAWTSDYHTLVRTGAHLVARDGTVLLVREFGPWFWIAWMYFGVTNAFGTVLLLRALVRTRDVFRGQALAILVGVTVPAAAQTTYFMGLSPYEPEAFVGVTAFAFGYAFDRHDLFDLVPVARDALVEELDDGVLVVDDADRVVDANPAVARMLGVTNVLGRPVAEVLPEGVREGFREGDESPVAVLDADGGERWVSVHRIDLRDASGVLVRLQDVTMLERRRREVERENERLNLVADAIGHDVRSPLTAASGSLELARETGADEHFERAERALDRVERIVDSTLRVARTDLGVPDRERVSLRAVADAAWGTAETNGMTLDAPDEGEVVADPAQLRSLFENLFRNAATHGNASTVTVRATGEGFVVADDGTGISEAERDKVFEHGYTTAETGTGLGLSIVRTIANAHDWDVRVTESESGGVAFVFTTDGSVVREQDDARAAEERAG